MTKMMGKAFTSILRHNPRYAREMNERGELPLNTLLDSLGNSVNPLRQHAGGGIFAAFIIGNNKQNCLDVCLHDTWYPDENPMAWSTYIGCIQGHSTGVVVPPQVSFHLTAAECLSLGWIFHVTDKKYRGSLLRHGLIRRGGG